jgi:hypothetical protein
MFFPKMGLVDVLDGEPKAAMPEVIGHLKPGDLPAGGCDERVKAGLGKLGIETIGGDGGAVGGLKIDSAVEGLSEGETHG